MAQAPPVKSGSVPENRGQVSSDNTNSRPQKQPPAAASSLQAKEERVYVTSLQEKEQERLSTKIISGHLHHHSDSEEEEEEETETTNTDNRDAINDVDMMDAMMGGTYPALPGDEMVRSTTTADVGLDDGDLVLNSTAVSSDLHHSDSEEEKEEETETTNTDNRDAINNVDMMDAMMGGTYPAPGDDMVSSTAIVSVQRSTTTATAGLARNGNNSSNTNPDEPLVPPAGFISKARPSNDSLNEGARNIGPSQRPGAYTAQGRAYGSRPSWHRRMGAHLAASFRQGSSQSLILGELAEASKEHKELQRRYQALQQIVNETVTGTAIVENSDAGDHDQNAASSPFGRKERRLLTGAAFALLLVVGVILGVTIRLTTNNNKDNPSIGSAVTCTSLECLLAEILLQNEVSDAEALQDDSSPQFLALRWLASNDPAVLDLDSMPIVILVERYVLAVLYFATSTEGGLNGLKSVCEWTGVLCNGDDLIVALLLGKSKHGEVLVLISKFRLDSPVFFHSASELETETDLKGSIPSELGKLASLTLLLLRTWIGLSCWH
jgi:hypothetical protein